MGGAKGETWESLYEWFEGWGIPPEIELLWTEDQLQMIECGDAA
jgi:hypothetical protein